MADHDLSETYWSKKDDHYPVIKVPDHALSEDVYKIHKMVSIYWVPLAKPRKKASFSITLACPTKPYEDLHTNKCPSQRSLYEGEPNENAVSKLVNDGQKNRST